MERTCGPLWFRRPSDPVRVGLVRVCRRVTTQERRESVGMAVEFIYDVEGGIVARPR